MYVLYPTPPPPHRPRSPETPALSSPPTPSPPLPTGREGEGEEEEEAEVLAEVLVACEAEEASNRFFTTRQLSTMWMSSITCVSVCVCV